MACDIFTFPSITRNEAFGISLAEAMYFGKPTVTFEIKGSGVNWVSIDGETGLVAKNGDAKDFASKIHSIANDQKLYLLLSNNSITRANTWFLRTRFYELVLKLFTELKI